MARSVWSLVAVVVIVVGVALPGRAQGMEARAVEARQVPVVSADVALDEVALPVVEVAVASGAAIAGVTAALLTIAGTGAAAVVTAILMINTPNVGPAIPLPQGLAVLGLLGLGAMATPVLPGLATGAGLYLTGEGWLPIVAGAAAATGTFGLAVPTVVAMAVGAGAFIDEDFALIPLVVMPALVLASTAAVAGLATGVAVGLTQGKSAEAPEPPGALSE